MRAATPWRRRVQHARQDSAQILRSTVEYVLGQRTLSAVHEWGGSMRRAIYRLVLLAGLLGLIPKPAFAEWLRAESPHFIFLAQMKQSELKDAAIGLEQFDAALRAITNIDAPPSENKLLVVLGSEQTLKIVSPGISPSVLGFYTATPSQTTFVAQNTSAEEVYVETGSRLQQKVVYLKARSIWQHEYAHHFMLQYFPSAYPKWYVEGYAEYVSTMSIKDGSIKLGSAESGRLLSLTNEWTPMEQIMAPKKAAISDRAAYSFYGQSWLAVHYLHSNSERNAQLRKYLAAISDGSATPADAFQRSFNIPFQEFDQQLRAYMRGKVVMRTYQGWRPPEPAITITPIDDREAEMTLLDLRLRIDPKSADANLRKRLQAAYESAEGGLAGRLAFARAELLSGKPERGLEALEGAQETADMLALRGELLLAQADTLSGEARDAARLQARKAFARANRLDPNHVASLVGFAHSLPADQELSENAMNVRLLAQQLAPQVESIALETAHALMAAERYEDAIGMLQSVAYRPHGRWSGYAAAMLQAAQARQPFTLSTDEWLKQQEAEGEGKE